MGQRMNAEPRLWFVRETRCGGGSEIEDVNSAFQGAGQRGKMMTLDLGGQCFNYASKCQARVVTSRQRTRKELRLGAVVRKSEVQGCRRPFFAKLASSCCM